MMLMSWQLSKVCKIKSSLLLNPKLTMSPSTIISNACKKSNSYLLRGWYHRSTNQPIRGPSFGNSLTNRVNCESFWNLKLLTRHRKMLLSTHLTTASPLSKGRLAQERLSLVQKLSSSCYKIWRKEEHKDCLPARSWSPAILTMPLTSSSITSSNTLKESSDWAEDRQMPNEDRCHQRMPWKIIWSRTMPVEPESSNMVWKENSICWDFSIFLRTDWNARVDWRI